MKTRDMVRSRSDKQFPLSRSLSHIFLESSRIALTVCGRLLLALTSDRGEVFSFHWTRRSCSSFSVLSIPRNSNGSKS